MLWLDLTRVCVKCSSKKGYGDDDDDDDDVQTNLLSAAMLLQAFFCFYAFNREKLTCWAFSSAQRERCKRKSYDKGEMKENAGEKDVWLFIRLPFHIPSTAVVVQQQQQQFSLVEWNSIRSVAVFVVGMMIIIIMQALLSYFWDVIWCDVILHAFIFCTYFSPEQSFIIWRGLCWRSASVNSFHSLPFCSFKMHVWYSVYVYKLTCCL